MPAASCVQNKTPGVLDGAQKGGESNEVKWRWRRPSQSPEMENYCGIDCGSGEQFRRPGGAMVEFVLGEKERMSRGIYRTREGKKLWLNGTESPARLSAEIFAVKWLEVEDRVTSWLTSRVGPACHWHKGKKLEALGGCYAG